MCVCTLDYRPIFTIDIMTQIIINNVGIIYTCIER